MTSLCRRTICSGVARLGDARQMTASDVAECHGGAERDAAAGIIAAHDARHVVAGGIEARDDLPVLIDDPCIRIGPEPGEGAEIARHHFDRIEGTALDGTDAGVRLVIPVHRGRPEWERPRRSLRPPGPTETPDGWVFRYQDPDAERVHLVGSFSEWNPEAFALLRADDRGLWSVTVDLPPGIYEYAYVVDGGEWVAPPEAAMYVDDGFGNRNGVLVIEDDTASDPR